MQTITIGDETVKQETLVPLDGQGNPVTLYGGTVTIYDDGSADVVSEYVIFNVTGEEDDSQFGKGNEARGYMQNIICPYSVKEKSGISDKLKIAYGGFLTMPIWSFYPKYTGYTWFRLFENTYNPTIAEIKSRIVELGGIQFLLELNTPITYHFSNLEELKVWLGENNFWCDISDDISVKYWNRGFGN